MNRRLLYIVLAGVAILPAIGQIAHKAGVRFNFTDSAPRGVWIAHDIQDIRRGMLVSVCPPESQALAAMQAKHLMPYGNCPLETMPLLKAIGAVSGDTVTVNGNSVSVNGKPVPNSSAIGSIRWKDGTWRVEPGQVWIFSTYVANSFDSRYFGPVSIKNIREEANPLLVDGNVDDMRRGIEP